MPYNSRLRLASNIACIPISFISPAAAGSPLLGTITRDVAPLPALDVDAAAAAHIAAPAAPAKLARSSGPEDHFFKTLSCQRDMDIIEVVAKSSKLFKTSKGRGRASGRKAKIALPFQR